MSLSEEAIDADSGEYGHMPDTEPAHIVYLFENLLLDVWHFLSAKADPKSPCNVGMADWIGWIVMNFIFIFRYGNVKEGDLL